MKITQEVAAYDTQGEDISGGEVETQPGDPGKNSTI